MTRKQRRAVFIFGGMATLAVAVALIASAYKDNMVFFYSPTEIAEKGIKPGQRIRLGGLVAEGSVKREANARIEFDVTDGTKALKVVHIGPLPDLFREKQGVVAEGTMDASGAFFSASNVLAKHDEKYMPREVAEALKKQGVWQGDGKPMAQPGKPISQ